MDDDNEWDESYPEQRISSENSTDILDALIARGVSTATAIKAATEILAAAATGKPGSKRHCFDLDRWIERRSERR